jgi:hypothetical protein
MDTLILNPLQIEILTFIGSVLGSWVAVRTQLAVTTEKAKRALEIADTAHERITAHVEKFHTHAGD